MRSVFDSIAVQAGDYLRGPRGVLFVAALPALLRPLCVLTTTNLDVLRPISAPAVGLNDYGGASENVLAPILSCWPGQVLADSASRSGVLPVDGGQANFTVLLPPMPAPVLPSDLLQDETGRRFLVRAAEGSEMGWRLLVRQTGI